MKARVEHRRAQMRFEVMGTMSASVVSTETLQVLNLGLSGVLVESPLPLPPNAEYRMQLVLEAHVSEVTVKVRRVSSSVTLDSGPPRYRIGLEFIAMTPEAEEAVSQFVLANGAHVRGDSSR